MPAYDFLTVDVFTDQRFGGNPLAVFPHATGLAEGQMLNLAREFNLSETAFVFPPVDPAHTARVRIFTPGSEIPFAGHPNVGTAFVLGRLDPGLAEELVFEEAAGLVAVKLLRGTDGQVKGASIAAPQPLSLGAEVPAEIVARCVGLTLGEICREAHFPVFAGVGIGCVFAELTSREALTRAAADHAAFRDAAVRVPEVGDRFSLHLYVRDRADSRRLYARMFAPLLGIREDPATGSANAALAALLVHLSGRDHAALDFEIEQGVEMRRPSLLQAAARRFADGSVRATVSGNCVPVLRGQAEA